MRLWLMQHCTCYIFNTMYYVSFNNVTAILLWIFWKTLTERLLINRSKPNKQSRVILKNVKSWSIFSKKNWFICAPLLTRSLWFPLKILGFGRFKWRFTKTSSQPLVWSVFCTSVCKYSSYLRVYPCYLLRIWTKVL